MNLKDTFQNPYMRYLAPLLVFLLLGALQSEASATDVWLFYGLKITVTALVFYLLFSGHWQEIAGRFDMKAIAAGIVVLVVWVAHYEYFSQDVVATFNPTLLESPVLMALAVMVRIAGAALVVPVLEEVVFRSFVPRFLTRNEFLTVPLGNYTHLSFWGAVVAFSIVHEPWQWPVAAFAGIVYGGYLVKTKNLKGCIIAHGVTNLGIAAYALVTGQWGLWG